MAKVNIDVKITYSVGLEFDTEDKNFLGALRNLERNTLEPENIDSYEEEVVSSFINANMRENLAHTVEYEIEQLSIDKEEIF